MFFVSLFVCLVIFFGLVGWLVCSLDYFVWVGEGGVLFYFYGIFLNILSSEKNWKGNLQTSALYKKSLCCRQNYAVSLCMIKIIITYSGLFTFKIFEDHYTLL